MFETLITWATSQVAVYAGGSILAYVVSTLILKKIPTKKVRAWIYELFYMIGKMISAAGNKWKWTAKIWENTIEPWICGFIDMIGGAVISGFLDGLRSDNE
ncbi:MAG: hypothetical protein KOO69_03510 [Victivallales bacterium]|nr:hypothetical protein [Victivallales bacterium]